MLGRYRDQGRRKCRSQRKACQPAGWPFRNFRRRGLGRPQWLDCYLGPASLRPEASLACLELQVGSVLCSIEKGDEPPCQLDGDGLFLGGLAEEPERR